LGSHRQWTPRAGIESGAPEAALSIAMFAETDRFSLPSGAFLVCTADCATPSDLPADDFVHIEIHRSVDLGICESVWKIVWSVPRRVLVQKLAMLSGQPVASDLHFEPALADPSESSLVPRLLDTLLAAIKTSREGTVIVAELEQVLITAFLDATRHCWKERLTERPRGAAPWQVRRAETYIEQNWHKPITIEDLAEVTGASPRSIFRTFQQSRGYTPLEFAKSVRLGHARRLLESAACTSVTDAAFACGFGDLGRFSRDFTQAFGERPSAVLSRRKALA
jgi:AraC-like DNA-binding protein